MSTRAATWVGRTNSGHFSLICRRVQMGAPHSRHSIDKQQAPLPSQSTTVSPRIDPNKPVIFRVFIAGAPGTGKSTLLRRFVHIDCSPFSQYITFEFSEIDSDLSKAEMQAKKLLVAAPKDQRVVDVLLLLVDVTVSSSLDFLAALIHLLWRVMGDQWAPLKSVAMTKFDQPVEKHALQMAQLAEFLVGHPMRGATSLKLDLMTNKGIDDMLTTLMFATSVVLRQHFKLFRTSIGSQEESEMGGEHPIISAIDKAFRDHIKDKEI